MIIESRWYWSSHYRDKFITILFSCCTIPICQLLKKWERSWVDKSLLSSKRNKGPIVMSQLDPWQICSFFSHSAFEQRRFLVNHTGSNVKKNCKMFLRIFKKVHDDGHSIFFLFMNLIWNYCLNCNFDEWLTHCVV